MVGRLIRKFIIALSVAMALALVGLAVCSRRGDLVLSVARDGGYHELRSDRTHVSMTHIARWALKEPPTWGRTGEAKIDPKLFIVRRAGTAAAMPPLPNIVLLDHIEVTLMPTVSTSWWRSFKSEGTAMMPSPTIAHSGSAWSGIMTGTTQSGTGTFVRGNNVPVVVDNSKSTAPGTVIATTQVAIPLRRVPTTLPSEFGSVTFSHPPSLANASPADRTSADMMGELKGLTDLTMHAAPKAPAAPALPWQTISAGGLSFAVANTFERYALPYWGMIVVVLIPVWIALLMAAARWARRASRRRRGLCVSCGYDLRGKPEGACPECGHASAVRGNSAPVAASV